uniref:Fork-head domain-containing protein n=1 Tax=Haplochromis burtoni TaxID=8153 RepID=A0A3Q2W008_HAPBU
MENQTGNLGSPLSLSDPASSAQKALLSNTTTYLAKIAIVLHDAPDKMLTFTQLMDKLTLFFSEDQKSIENNVRVCLSTNKCFVKVPIVPYSLNSKRNYWKLDLTQITAKMMRRHFRGILQLFPDLACKMQKENLSKQSQHCATSSSHELEARRSVRIQREVKFRGPFSIDSLLKTDEHSAQNPGASPLSGVPLRVEQSHLLAGPHMHHSSANHCSTTKLSGLPELSVQFSGPFLQRLCSGHQSLSSLQCSPQSGAAALCILHTGPNKGKSPGPSSCRL